MSLRDYFDTLIYNVRGANPAAPATVEQTPTVRLVTAPGPPAEVDTTTWVCRQCGLSNPADDLTCNNCARTAPPRPWHDAGYCCPDCQQLTDIITARKAAGLPLDGITVPDHPRGGAR